MNNFQKSIEGWFERDVESRSINHNIEFQFVLGSDIGLKREQNQDKVAAMYTGDSSTNPLFVIAVSDGMGGMSNGKECATMAISGFFYALVQYRHLNARQRAMASIEYANNTVFEKYNGNGGATLSAILIDKSAEPLKVHIGDSRIYSFGSGKTIRHTTDDSMAEALGAQGTELLQFIGMGKSMRPSVEPILSQNPYYVITSDGIHGMEDKTLTDILNHSSDIKQVSERLSAISRWSGGIDNASIAAFDIQQLANYIVSPQKYHGAGVQLWDPFGDLTLLWLKDEVIADKQRESDEELYQGHVANAASRQNIDENKKATEKVPDKRRAKKRRKQVDLVPQGKTVKDAVQLNIEVGENLKHGATYDGTDR